MTNPLTTLHDPEVIGLILNYRDATRTVRCIASLLDDGISHILVWDNSGDDGASANTLRERLVHESRVSVETTGINLGFAAGVNRGLAWIHENFPKAWVLLINNDAVLLRGATDALADALKNKHEAAIAYPTIDHGGCHIGTVFYQRHFGLITHKQLVGSFPYASGCCQLLAPKRLSGSWFDESYFMYGEDMEQGYRLGKKRMVHVPSVWVRHEGSASSGIGSVFYETRMVAAHWLLAGALSRNRIDLGMLYVGRALALSARALLRAGRYRSLIPLRCLHEGWRLAHPKKP